MSPAKKRKSREELSPLEQALDDLTKDRGVAGNDLDRLLTDKLRDYWGVPPGEHDLQVLRAYTTANLNRIIESLEPKTAALAESYWTAVKSCFNLLPGVGLDDRDFTETDALARRIWAAAACRISEGTVRNYQADAYEKMVAKLESGTYVPVLPSEFEKYGAPPIGIVRPTGDLRAPDAAAPSTEVLDGNGADLLPSTDEATPEQQSTGSPSRIKYWHRWPKRTRAAAICTVTGLVLAAAVVMIVRLNHGSDHSSVDTGTSLLVTASSTNGYDLGYSMVFPTKTGTASKRFLAAITGPEAGANINDAAGFAQAMEAGAYGYGGVTVTLDIESLSDQEVNVSNIRAVVRRKRQNVAGTLLDYPGQAGPVHTLYYDLDKPNSVPKDNAPDGPPFFTTEQIGVTKSSPETVILKFGAVTAAYDFNIAVDYEVGGQTFTQYARLSKNSSDLLLHVTGSLCKAAADGQSGSIGGASSYDRVFRFGGGYTPGANPGPSDISIVSSRDFAAHGCE